MEKFLAGMNVALVSPTMTEALSQVLISVVQSSRTKLGQLPVTTSITPSRLKSPTTICIGPAATGYSAGSANVPSPWPRNTSTNPSPKPESVAGLPAATSRSSRPSWSTSAAVTSLV